MGRKRQNVISVLQVKPLSVCGFVVDYPHSGDVIDYVPCLSVEEVVATVVPPVPNVQRANIRVKMTVKRLRLLMFFFLKSWQVQKWHIFI